MNLGIFFVFDQKIPEFQSAAFQDQLAKLEIGSVDHHLVTCCLTINSGRNPFQSDDPRIPN